MRGRIDSASALALCALFAVSTGHAQSEPVDLTPSRQAIEDAAGNRCDGVSVVVRRCVAQPDSGKSDQPDDALSRSRARAKAAFDRRDRRTRQDALEGNNDAADDTVSIGEAQRLAPVIVTGTADELPPSIEEILQRALNPQVVAPNGTVTTYAPDGTRIECIARCVGPMCCLTLRNRPDPARESNSIGR